MPYTRIGHLVIGGPSTVSLVRRHSDNKVMVRKRFNLNISNFTSWIPNEVRMLQELGSHPRILGISEWKANNQNGIQDGQELHSISYFMEYCDAGDVKDVLDHCIDHRMPVPESFLWHFLEQATEALAHVHREPFSYIHSDVKPSNFFLRWNMSGPNETFEDRLSRNEYPDVVLADFGLLSQHEGPSYGTNGYDSGDKLQRTIKGDVFALGVTLWQLMYGHDVEDYEATGRDQPHSIDGPTRSTELEEIVSVLMDPDKEFRPSLAKLCERIKAHRATLDPMPIDLTIFQRPIVVRSRTMQKLHDVKKRAICFVEKWLGPFETYDWDASSIRSSGNVTPCKYVPHRFD